MRVLSYASFVTFLVGIGSAKAAQAKASEGALAIGEELMEVADTLGDSTHELSLNGQTIFVASAQTKQPLRAVLDRFERDCDERADAMLDDLQHLSDRIDAPRPAPTADDHAGVGSLRDVRDARGVIACFATGETTDHAGLAGRLSKFAESHDLAALGHLRYVTARTTEDGTTLVVASWTNGSFRLDDAFPATGDAAGEEPTFVPRPGSARRLLSAHDAHAPYGVFVYESERADDVALADEGRALVARGFVEHGTVNERAKDTRGFSKDGVDVIVTAVKTDDGKTVVSIVEMPAPGAGKKEPK